MASICDHCAVRMLNATRSCTRNASQRSFSITTARRKGGLPSFSETTQPELDDVLASMRSKHFIPAYLHASERRTIFGTKFRQSLIDNPQTVNLGNEEIPLQWINRRTEIPSRKKLLNKAIKLMANGESKDWRNLPALLTGLHTAKATPDKDTMEKIVRLAVDTGHLSTIIVCLQKPTSTGMTLLRPEVLEYVTWGLHDTAQRGEWSKGATAQALKYANQVALLLETEEHGGGDSLRRGDARKDPAVIGVFLELVSVYAYKHQGGQDADGKVKAYAQRLLFNCKSRHEELKNHAPAAYGPQHEMLHNIPIWHGLHLADKILGANLPEMELARKMIHNYQAGLENLTKAIEATKPKPGSYGEQAVTAWRNCIRD